MTPSLFDTLADRNLAHVQELLAKDSGPWPLQADQRAFLREMERCVGKDKAMPLSRMQDRLRMALASPRLSEEERRRFHITEDRVKSIVHDLRVDYKAQIGASRTAGAGGYYLVATREEAYESSQQMVNQACSMFKAAAVFRGAREIAEMLGQLRLQIQPESVPDATGVSSEEVTHVSRT